MKHIKALFTKKKFTVPIIVFASLALLYALALVPAIINDLKSNPAVIIATPAVANDIGTVIDFAVNPITTTASDLAKTTVTLVLGNDFIDMAISISIEDTKRPVLIC